MREKRNTLFRLLFIIGCFIVIGYSCHKDQDDPNIVKDIDGNIYHTVSIGNQVWMVENLKTTRYNDGTAIPNVTDSTAWSKLSTPAYCWYNNDAASYKATYGALYNWYAVNTQKLCPKGWHVPTKTELDNLTNYLGGINIAGGKMKEAGTAHWQSPNSYATNESGFTGLPGGVMMPLGRCRSLGQQGYFWSSTDFDSIRAWEYNVDFESSAIFVFNPGKQGGVSVRCLKD